MEQFIKSFKLIVLVFLISCNNDDSQTVEVQQSDQANLLKFELVLEDIIYETSIEDQKIVLNEILPYSTDFIRVNSIDLSNKAISNIKEGDSLQVTDNTIYFEVIAEDNETKRVYTLELNQYEKVTCENSEIFRYKDFFLENNMWNSSYLPSGTYSQCMYQYNENTDAILGWEWSFPDDAYGVNAYPEIIFGWKPWFQESSTQKLPKKISEIEKLKAKYEVEVSRNDGFYNLAFDNWIHSSADINPQNIQFEFMIWEDDSDLVPFGDFQENVATTNGTYRFYIGDPDWEPPGSEWIYLAFQRVEGRNSGTVDIDELLSYLVNSGVVPADSYLASLEFGNEVGNSKGITIFKQFEIDIE